MKNNTSIYVALLKGVNVSGTNRIIMADLKKMIQEMGYSDVTTYIQSGNIIFRATTPEKKELAEAITKKIEEVFNLVVPCIVLTYKDISEIIEKIPFQNNSDINKLHIGFLESAANTNLTELTFNQDKGLIKDDVVYLYCESGYGNTKLNNNYLEKKLKTKVTVRNLKTVSNLLSLITKLAESID